MAKQVRVKAHRRAGHAVKAFIRNVEGGSNSGQAGGKIKMGQSRKAFVRDTSANKKPTSFQKMVKSNFSKGRASTKQVENWIKHINITPSYARSDVIKAVQKHPLFDMKQFSRVAKNYNAKLKK